MWEDEVTFPGGYRQLPRNITMVHFPHFILHGNSVIQHRLVIFCGKKQSHQVGDLMQGREMVSCLYCVFSLDQKVEETQTDEFHWIGHRVNRGMALNACT